MNIAIQKAIDDIKGYRSFSDQIDIAFVVALLGVYKEEEIKNIKSSFLDGKNPVFKSVSEDDYLTKTYNK